MKKALIVVLICFLSMKGFSNNIVDIFYLIPAGIDLDTKKELVDFYYKETSKIKESERQRTSCKDFVNVIDKSNGFLSLSINCGDGIIEICYWTQESGDKLIAINNYGFATSKFTETIDFYLLKDSKLKKLESENIIPYEKIRTKLLRNELNDQLILEAKQNGLYEDESIVFELPRYGKAIKASFGLDDSDNWSSRLLDKRACELSWNNLKLELK